MKVCDGNNTRYYDDYHDKFVESKNQNVKLKENYVWIRKNFFYKIFGQILYMIATVFSLIYCNLVLHIKIENRSAFKEAKRTGCFFYGNHTQPIGDAFSPILYAFPKRIYTVAGAANLGIPFLGKIIPALGGIIIPDEKKHMKEFLDALRYRLDKRSCIVIYPEAEVWPYCGFVREFPVTSFRFPVMFDAPAFCMTTTYQKRKFGKKPKITTYIDGPFYADKTMRAKDAQIRLHDDIYACMSKRSKNNTYEYIRYERRIKR